MSFYAVLGHKDIRTYFSAVGDKDIRAASGQERHKAKWEVGNEK